MTSTPTACPSCGAKECKWHFGKRCTKYDKPRQPDNEMNELLMETIVRGQNKPDTSAARMAAISDYANVVANAHTQIYHPTFYFGDGYDAGHARALKAMGAECISLFLHEQRMRSVEEQLAAAQSELATIRNYESSALGEAHAYGKARTKELGEALVERDDAELRAGEYEKALEQIAEYESDDAIACVMIAHEVLAAHRRGGEGV